MKFSFLLPFLALTAAPAAAWAQAPVAKTTTRTATQPGGRPSTAPTEAQITAKADALTANMQKNLALTPQQTEKVRVINRRGVEQVESIRVRYRNEPAQMVALIEGVGSGRLMALKDVLSPGQFDKYQRKREEKMGLPSAPAATGNEAPGLGRQGQSQGE